MTIWNEPKQERSRKRFDHILDTAAVLFQQQGYESVTTNHIAEHAQVAIGSLYQFFPNKEAVLGALVNRYIEEMKSIFPAHVETFEGYINLLIDNLAMFEMTHAAFKSIFVTVHGPKDQIHSVIVNNIEAVLGTYFPHLTIEQRRTCASVGIGIVKGLMILAEPPYALPPQVMLTETKTALIAYVQAFVERELS